MTYTRWCPSMWTSPGRQPTGPGRRPTSRKEIMDIEPIDTPEKIEAALEEYVTISSERRDALKEADPELTDEKIDEEIQATREEVRETHLRNLERAKDQYERLGIHHTCTS